MKWPRLRQRQESGLQPLTASIDPGTVAQAAATSTLSGSSPAPDWNLLLADANFRKALSDSMSGLVNHLPGKERTTRWTRITGFVVGGVLGLSAIGATFWLVHDKLMGSDAGAFIFGAVITAALAMVREGLAGE